MSVALPTLEDRRASQPSGDKHIPEPEPVHIRDHGDTIQNETDDDEREASELRTPAQLQATKQKRISRIISPGLPRTSWYGGVQKLWRHNIQIAVPHVDCRDHL
ncbi:hypothetical protein LTR86_004003, partial [Recurvomyces mirabilis]